MTTRLLCLCCLLAASTAAAQGANATPEQPQDLVLETYEPRLSWPLFAACDQNGDDRLDLLEAKDGIVGLVVANEPTAFQPLDANKNGFLEWSEFDRRYYEAIRTSGKFTVRLRHPLHIPFDPTDTERATTREAALMRLVDRDNDQQLAPGEYRYFVVDAELGTRAPGFVVLDADDSGFLSLAEFTEVLALLPDSGAAYVERVEQSPDTLPAAYREVDANRDNLLDRAELTQGLVAIDPSLRRWAKRILDDADFSGNGRLGKPEIERASGPR